MDVAILAFLILLNGIFAMSEIAIVSSRRIRLEQAAEAGDGGAAAALRLADQPTRFLSTIQIGITLIGILSGAFGEATLVKQLAPHFEGLPLIGPHARDVAFGVVVVGITFASLVFGELVPKRIAMQRPERIASFIGMPMTWLARAMAPFVKALSASTDLILRVLGVRSSTEPSVTGEEIEGLMRQGAEEGVFEQHEHAIVSRILKLDEQTVQRIMTPRLDIDFLDLDAEYETIAAKLADGSHSRYPVCRGDMSHVIGVLRAHDVLTEALAGGRIDPGKHVRPPLYVPESVTVTSLLETFKRHRESFAILVDEYGETTGIVTLTDVLEGILGDIPDASDHTDPDAVRREDGSWLLDGSMSLDRFREALATDLRFPEEQDGRYHTLGGYLMASLARIPIVGDRSEHDGFRFEVVDMDRNRVDKLLVVPPPPDEFQQSG